MVQWLGFSAFPDMVKVQSLVGELKSHKLHGMVKKKKKIHGIPLIYFSFVVSLIMFFFQS